MHHFEQARRASVDEHAHIGVGLQYCAGVVACTTGRNQDR